MIPLDDRLPAYSLRLPLGTRQCETLAEDVRQALQVILSTPRGTRPLEPEFGCDLRRLLFRPESPELFSQIRYMVKDAIERWERRAKLENVSVQKTADRGLRIQVQYRCDNELQKLDLLAEGGTLAPATFLADDV